MGSLRWAVDQANASPGPDTINFDSTLFSTQQTITLTRGKLTLSDAATTTISGAGANLLSISGDNLSRIFQIAAGANVILDGMTLTDGNDDRGGAILNLGALTVNDSTLSGNIASSYGGAIANLYGGMLSVSNDDFTDNSATNSVGGGIASLLGSSLAVANSTFSGNKARVGGGIDTENGTATISGSTITGNSASDQGGGVSNYQGMLAITNSTISNNTAQDQAGGIDNTAGTLIVTDSTIFANSSTSSVGGGIASVSNSALTVSNSTLFGNSARIGGGIDTEGGTASITESTISGNSASVLGGGISSYLSTLTVNNTIVAHSSGGDVAVVGPVTGSHNLIQDGSGGLSGTIIGDPLLDPLANYGGPTLTMPLRSASPAVDAGDNSLIPDDVTTDQRGFARITGSEVDIGACEGATDVISSPTVSTDRATVSAAEGGSVANTGEFDDVGGNNNVTLSADIGTVTQIDVTGTWSWSLPVGDGPAGPISVTITATDNLGSSATTTFTYTTTNVVPTATLQTNSGVNDLSPALASLVNPFDPGTADASAGFHYAFSVDTDTTGSATYASSGTSNSANFGVLSAGAHTVFARIIDKDNGSTLFSQVLTVAPNGGTTFTVTNALDDGSVGSLRWAVNQANSHPGADTIVFDTTVFKTLQTIHLTGGKLTLTDPATTTIDGPGVNLLSIDGQHHNRVFQLSVGAFANLNNMTIANGSDSIGGGIFNQGTLTVANSAFINNFADGYGGGIANVFGGSLIVSNTSFTNNTANDSVGGGIANLFGSTLTISNSTFSGNDARIGGGIDNEGGIATVTNVSISGSSVTDQGAGISNFKASLTVAGSNIFNNTAANLAGGIGNTQGTLTVTQSTISNNTATTGVGGGIANLSGIMLTVADSVISSNHGRIGGGVDTERSTATLTNSIISGNSASDQGGGISNYLGSLTITNSTIANNTATNLAGGIDNTTGTLTITNSTISGNHGRIGGGIGSFTASILTLTNSTVYDNSGAVGGGIDTERGAAVITNSTISGNSASVLGGGISNYLSTLAVNNTIVAHSTGADIALTKAVAVTGSHNLIQDGSGGLSGTITGNPNLTALGNYGGATQTFGLLADSLAIDAGSNALIPKDVTTDQRGLPRIFNSIVDIGAYELTPNSPPTVATDNASVSAAEGSSVSNTGTFNDPDGNNTVTLSADIGTVTQTNATGTWNWSLPASDSPAGPITVTITATDDQNATATTMFTYSINSVPPMATLQTNSGLTYGSAAAATLVDPVDPSESATTAGFHYVFSLDTDTTGTATYASSGTSNFANFGVISAGTHTVFARIIDIDNASSAYSMSVDVAHAKLSITANDDSKNFGVVKSFSPGAFTESGLVSGTGDSILGVTENSAGTPAAAAPGTYAIIPSAATGTGLANYTICYVNGTLTVMSVNPTVTSATATNVTSTIATLSANVTDSGSAPVTKRGFLYAPTFTNAHPTQPGDGVIEVDFSPAATGIFSINLTGLIPLTGYSFVAFATSDAGTGYSSVASIMTTPTGPATSITGSNNPTLGQSFTYTLNAYEPNSALQLQKHVFHINWGDGKSTVVTGLNGITTTHAYASSGTYTIQVSATDSIGSILPTATLLAMVGPTLTITGSVGNDVIVLTSPSSGSIDVLVNGIDQGTFNPTTSVVVVGNGGIDSLIAPNAASLSTWTLTGLESGTLSNSALPTLVSFSGISNLTGGTGPDKFIVRSTSSGFAALDGGAGANILDYSQFTTSVSVNLLTHAATKVSSVSNVSMVLGGSAGDILIADNSSGVTLIGGSGSDTLTGGSGADVLLGGAGNDALQAGSGRTLLVGGSGSDSFTGGAGDDILIGGQLSYYNESTGIANTTALSTIMAEWSRTDESFDQRMANLGNGGGSNGSNVLNTTTISDDAVAVDSLFAGSGQDWFFAFATDSIANKKGGDAVTTLP